MSTALLHFDNGENYVNIEQVVVLGRVCLTYVLLKLIDI